MALINGAGPSHRARHGGRAKTKDAFGKRSPSSRSQVFPQSQYAITDGRTAVGTVEIIDGYYVAFDCHGSIIGRFQTLRHAVRALPYGGAS